MGCNERSIYISSEQPSPLALPSCTSLYCIFSISSPYVSLCAVLLLIDKSNTWIMQCYSADDTKSISYTFYKHNLIVLSFHAVLMLLFVLPFWRPRPKFIEVFPRKLQILPPLLISKSI